MKKDDSWRWKLIGVIIVLAATIYFLGGVSGASDNGSQRIICSGTAEFDIAGFGDIELDPLPQCRLDACGFLGFSIFSDDGQVKMYVDGRLVDSAGLKSDILGSNDEFTLTSSCIDDPGIVELVLYDENGIQQDRYEVTI